jgi:hypothetical protein
MNPTWYFEILINESYMVFWKQHLHEVRVPGVRGDVERGEVFHRRPTVDVAACIDVTTSINVATCIHVAACISVAACIDVNFATSDCAAVDASLAVVKWSVAVAVITA